MVVDGLSRKPSVPRAYPTDDSDALDASVAGLGASLSALGGGGLPEEVFLGEEVSFDTLPLRLPYQVRPFFSSLCWPCPPM